MRNSLIGLLSATALVVGMTQQAAAQDTIKVGLIMTLSGQFADAGIQMQNGVKTYMQQFGDTIGGKKIELIVKDSGGMAPDVAKRLAQELVIRDKIDILAGFVLTPNALAACDVAEEAKKMMVIMNAATSIITTKSKYCVRVSLTLPMVTDSLGSWATKRGIKQMGDTALGIITAWHYDHNHDSKMNKDFVAAFKKETNGVNPNFLAVGGYDGMHLIYGALKATNGDTDGDKLIEAAKMMKWESPRGPIAIDPETRDIVQTIYIRKAEKVGGVLVN